MRNLAKRLTALASDLESHLDDRDLENVHNLMAYVVDRLLEVTDEITTTQNET